MTTDEPEPKPHLATMLAALQEAIVCAQTAQITGEANPVLLESYILELRSIRYKIIGMLEES